MARNALRPLEAVPQHASVRAAALPVRSEESRQATRRSVLTGWQQGTEIELVCCRMRARLAQDIVGCAAGEVGATSNSEARQLDNGQ